MRPVSNREDGMSLGGFENGTRKVSKKHYGPFPSLMLEPNGDHLLEQNLGLLRHARLVMGLQGIITTPALVIARGSRG